MQGRYVQIVWYIGDIFNAMMSFPNLVGLIVLAPMLYRITKKALKQGLDKPFTITAEDVR
jgi:Na+/alanine symporter